MGLGKIVNHFAEQERGSRRSISRSVSVANSVIGDEKTGAEDSVLASEPIKEEEGLDDDDGPGNDTIRQQESRDDESLVEELLTDGE